MKNRDKGAAIAFWGTIIVLMLFMLKGAADCHSRGGAYVQGAIWFECVAGAKR